MSATIDATEKEKLLQVEQDIAAEFETALANDAMLPVQFTLEDVNAFDPLSAQSHFGGKECVILKSTITWESESRNLFVVAGDDAENFLARVIEINEAIDSLDVLFDNWNLAAANLFTAKLDPAPEFSVIDVEKREITEDDYTIDGLLFTYSLALNDTRIKVGRFCDAAWQTILAAAGLEVTTVDESELPGSTSMEAAEDAPAEQTTEPVRGSTESVGEQSIEMLYDLSLDVVVELGRTRKPIQDILKLGRGSIVELEKLAGDPVDVYVNDRKLAEGEVVVVDDHFGVRITNLIHKSERVRNLG